MKNVMIPNPDKCYFLTLGFHDSRIPNPLFLMITLQSKMHQKILAITTDNKLTFKSHLKNISKKANQKLNALARIMKFKSHFQGKLC